ncbi:MAG: class I SAM-dependent methyltransferase [Bacteroides sp.]|jgi:SAM-dependent methyltransferase|nr:class I SAM-dependent methyltransferase [Bacteroides sp.]
MKKKKEYSSGPQLYTDYQWVWELVSSREEYASLADYVVMQIRDHEQQPTRSLLHLGCGSGNMDHHLKQHFSVTGVDLSGDMLSSARRKNPECDYHTGDMRTFSTTKRFDAVIIPDSIDYLRSPSEMLQVFSNAKKLLNPGGLLLAIVGYDPEKFPQNRTTVETASEKGVEITFIENNYVPDQGDPSFEATFICLIRDQRRLKTMIDVHILGLFSKDLWFKELERAGFEGVLYQDGLLEKVVQQGAFLLIGILPA